MKLLKAISLISAIFMAACGSHAEKPNVEVVSPQEFQARLDNDSGGYLLDVRRPDEFEAAHIDGAHLLDWLDTDRFKKESESLDKSRTLYVYCRSGRRSNEAANYLAGQGYKVVDLQGGILAWQKEKRPVTTGDQSEKD